MTQSNFSNMYVPGHILHLKICTPNSKYGESKEACFIWILSGPTVTPTQVANQLVMQAPSTKLTEIYTVVSTISSTYLATPGIV